MILITGATGQVGTTLVAELRAQKLPFRALAHTPASYEKLTSQGIETVLDDDTQPQTLAGAFVGIERLFLLTPGGSAQVGIERRLVEAAQQANVRHIVKLSAFGVGDIGVSILGVHQASEEYIRQSGIDYTFLRPNAFMQNLGNRDAARIKQQGGITNSVGDGEISFIDTRDIAAVATAALSDDRHIGQTYLLTGPEALSYGEVAQKLTALLGRSVNYMPLSDEAYRAALLAAGLPPALAAGLTELYRFYGEGKGAEVTNTVEQITGRPARSFDTYMAEHRALFE